ncbi:MAG: hypothetical protein ABTQ34_08740 [Bdellovibrionales bacterium]
MVQEFRKITLSPDELVCAVRSYSRMTPQFLPDGKIFSCMPNSDGSLALVMEIPFGAVLKRTDFTLKGLDVLRPLIRFCIENNILLPRSGQKSISVENGMLSMCITLDLNIDVTDCAAATSLIGAMPQGK